MNYTARRNISLTIAVVLVLAAIILFFALDWPVFKRIGELNKKISQEQAQYQEQFRAVQTAKSIINQYKGLTGVSQTISLSVPRGPEIENVVSQLDKLAISAGLEVQSINFETPSLPTLKDQKKTSVAQDNKILRISLSLVGSYDSFKTWLAAAESNIRLMDIKTISFSSAAAEEGGAGRFNFKVSLDAYYQ